MYKVYVLKSLNRKRYYIGHTSDFSTRLKKHNAGQVRSTKAYAPWTLVYSEDFQTKSEAQKREYEIKSYKSGIKFKQLILERC